MQSKRSKSNKPKVINCSLYSVLNLILIHLRLDSFKYASWWGRLLLYKWQRKKNPGTKELNNFIFFVKYHFISPSKKKSGSEDIAKGSVLPNYFVYGLKSRNFCVQLSEHTKMNEFFVRVSVTAMFWGQDIYCVMRFLFKLLI